MVKEHLTIPCPHCGEPMPFTGAQPAAGALSELWRFACAACDEIKVIAKTESARPELRAGDHARPIAPANMRPKPEEFCLT